MRQSQKSSETEQRKSRTKEYTMKEALDVAKLAASDIESYLDKQPETLSIINVEDDLCFRELDIDLVQQTKYGYVLIEIKGDRYYQTGNYFFETTSNKDRNTEGCFLYTLADYVYYYFVDKKIVHILPMPETREWFEKNIDRFEEKTTSTSVGEGKYFTTGRIVPRRIVLKEVKGVKIKFLDKT